MLKKTKCRISYASAWCLTLLDAFTHFGHAKRFSHIEGSSCHPAQNGFRRISHTNCNDFIIIIRCVRSGMWTEINGTHFSFIYTICMRTVWLGVWIKNKFPFFFSPFVCVASRYFLHHYYLNFECTNTREYSTLSLTLFTLCINALFIALFSFEPCPTTKTTFEKTEKTNQTFFGRYIVYDGRRSTFTAWNMTTATTQRRGKEIFILNVACINSINK